MDRYLRKENIVDLHKKKSLSLNEYIIMFCELLL